jgi:hypothetical protein
MLTQKLSSLMSATKAVTHPCSYTGWALKGYISLWTAGLLSLTEQDGVFMNDDMGCVVATWKGL